MGSTGRRSGLLRILAALAAGLAASALALPAAAVPATATAADCPDGNPRCVEATIAQMRHRFAPLGRACHHHAAFALAYLRTTQTYKWARDRNGFFQDPTWVNREDAVFADYYFRAYGDWTAGRRPAVPPAWLTALDAARDRRVTGVGDVMLGMNAHVNRDLPFVLAQVGITDPQGRSRKPDHDRVNDFLRLVIDPLLAEAASRFDPYSFIDAGQDVIFGVLTSWREQAWRNAEALVTAPDPAARAAVARRIEDAAAGNAAAIVALNSYVPPITTTRPRDRHCAAHESDGAPKPYPFGSPEPYRRTAR